jgi:methylmalonyl-CoA/ethylmalonyl-CoA epimerase
MKGGTVMVQKIDHVVIAVNDLNEGMAQYEKTLGLKPSRIGERPGDGFKSAFYDLPGGGFIELIQPTDATGPVAKGLAARGEGVYLVSLAVEDIDAEVAGMRSRGVRLIGDPGPDKPITGMVFVHPRETRGVLMQLVQRKPGA